MSAEFIDLHTWFQTPAGRYLRAWEQDQVDSAVADIFGYHAMQLGLPGFDGLRNNRMPHQWLANECDDTFNASAPRKTALLTQFSALPFPASSLDLVVLPHTLEFCADPHGTLRDVERVLVPEGRVVICGLNPASLWGLRQRRSRLYRRMGVGNLFLPDGGQFIGHWRIRDWLRLLGFEVEHASFGCYRPSVQNEQWLQRTAWMDRVGSRWWPIFGAAYFLVAVKRVKGMHLLSPNWKQAKVRAPQSVPVANRSREFFNTED
jgi:SAM-dependent methyltransferase